MIAENSLASPKLSTAITLHVIVYDVSDHKPKFTRPRYEAEVLESAASGTSVIQINVTNSEQVYEMELQSVTLILPFGHVRVENRTVVRLVACANLDPGYTNILSLK